MHTGFEHILSVLSEMGVREPYVALIVRDVVSCFLRAPFGSAQAHTQK